MALIKCPECGKKISDKANVCIHCGYPVNNDAENQNVAEERVVVAESIQEEKSEKRGKRKVNLTILLLSIVIALALIGTMVCFFVLKPSYEDATTQYETMHSSYNSLIDSYRSTSELIKEKNDELNAAINDLQKLVSSEEKPYDPNTIVEANLAINEGKIALVDILTWEERNLKNVADYNLFQVGIVKKDIEIIESYINQLADIMEMMEIPEYSLEHSEIDEAKTALEFSIKQMQQVTCPSESFVLQRIMNIRNQARMKDIISLTEDNDPENYIGKAGWYTVKIVFHHKDVEHYGLDNGSLSLNEVGNPAGGCIEVYRTEEDAQRRADQLKSQEGTEKSPGARMVCGTMVIRVSDRLKASYQQELLKILADELLRIGENQEQGNVPSEPDMPLEITPAFKDAMDNYEKFFDEYIAFMKTYSTSDNVFEMMDDYTSYIKQYAETMEKINEINCDELSAIDYAYYVEVNSRIAQKLLELDDLKINGSDKTEPTEGDNITTYPEQDEVRPTEPIISRNELAVQQANVLCSTYTPVDRRWLHEWLVNVDGFTIEEAQYAVDNCDTDWNVWVLEYINTSFYDSPTRAKEELSSLLFTDIEINYAIKNGDVDWNSRALESMRFLSWTVNSRVEVFDFLTCIEGFTTEQANYALENCNWDWREMAVDYLENEYYDAHNVCICYCGDHGAFLETVNGCCPICNQTQYTGRPVYTSTKEECKNHLESMGYTADEAKYAVDGESDIYFPDSSGFRNLLAYYSLDEYITNSQPHVPTEDELSEKLKLWGYSDSEIAFAISQIEDYRFVS